MSNIEQIPVSVMGRTFSIGTPASEKDTLLQALDMLNKIIIIAALNVVHDLLKMSMKDGLAIGEFERRITHMTEVCDKALAKVP